MTRYVYCKALERPVEEKIPDGVHINQTTRHELNYIKGVVKSNCEASRNFVATWNNLQTDKRKRLVTPTLKSWLERYIANFRPPKAVQGDVVLAVARGYLDQVSR